MKCLTCNECSEKEDCAKANGFLKAPFPLIEYKIKLCTQIFNVYERSNLFGTGYVMTVTQINGLNCVFTGLKKDCLEWIKEHSAMEVIK